MIIEKCSFCNKDTPIFRICQNKSDRVCIAKLCCCCGAIRCRYCIISDLKIKRQDKEILK